MKGEQIIEPLLYIDQPTFQKPKAYMQDHYRNEMNKPKEKEPSTTLEEIEEDIPQVSSNSDKSFKNLTIQEKIHYLVSLPSEVPQMRCEVITDSKKYRGTIIDESDKEITLETFGRENTIVHKNEISKINLLGF